MPEILDDKSEECRAFILEQLKVHENGPNAKQPLFVGLNGVQGLSDTGQK